MTLVCAPVVTVTLVCAPVVTDHNHGLEARDMYGRSGNVFKSDDALTTQSTLH